MGRASTKNRGSGKLSSRGGGSSKSKKAVDQMVGELLRLAEESGELPWDRPWNIAGMPRNAVSGREYRGINLFYLGLLASAQGYNSSRWMTYNQAREQSFQQWRKEKGLPDNDAARQQYKDDPDGYRGVRRGEKGTSVIFFKPVPRKENGQVVLNANGDPEMRLIRAAYTVFNADQTDLEFPPEAEERDDVQPIKKAEEILDGFQGAPPVKHGGDVACYVPGDDEIRMPLPERFHSDEDYYHALFHEMIHATGHASRTNRAQGDWSGMGSESYAEEELVAEIGAAILSAHAGIRTDDRARRHSAAYLQSWMKKLKKRSGSFCSRSHACSNSSRPYSWHRV